MDSTHALWLVEKLFYMRVCKHGFHPLFAHEVNSLFFSLCTLLCYRLINKKIKYFIFTSQEWKKMGNYQSFFRTWSSKVVHQQQPYKISSSGLNSKQNPLFPSLQKKALVDRITIITQTLFCTLVWPSEKGIEKPLEIMTKTELDSEIFIFTLKPEGNSFFSLR
mgnify:CR=1 FL=1